jgi:hypothetical protein
MSTVKFQPGVGYYARSIGDYNCIFRFHIVRRSAASVWVREEGSEKIERRKVSTYGGAEIFSPYGKYSMSPTVAADKRLEDLEAGA